ncbi:MAG: hypothetical protein JWQ03_338 [Variovorax sp.]|nr:hypothetical protein [Variovorax sp.]
MAMLGNLHQRVGDEEARPAGDGAGGNRTAWGRVISTDVDIRQQGTVTPSSKGRVSGFQVGTDLWAPADWRTGIYVGQLEGDASVTGFARGVLGNNVGTNDLRSQYLGLYGTYTPAATGFYADAVLQAGRHRYAAHPTFNVPASGSGRSLLASIEVGQSFALAQNWSIEPQLQLAHQSLNLDDALIPGALVQQNSHNGWIARAGVRVKGMFATSAGTLQPYARFNVYHAGAGTDIARFIAPGGFTDVASRTGSTSTELAGGFTLGFRPGWSLYGELGRLFASGGDARVQSSIQGSIGIKARW